MMRGFVCLLLCLLIPAQALAVSQSPYPGYTYDVWGRSVPAPSGYVCRQVVFPQDQGAGEIKKAQDLFVYQDKLYIVDTGNNRIIALDENYEFALELSSFVLPDGTATTLSSPKGIYIRDDRMMIADTGNGRVLVCDMEGRVDMVLTKPVTEFISEQASFRPAKVGMDASGFIYVMGEGVYQGLISYNSKGEFTGFYGSNKVVVDFSVIVGQLWKKLLSQEQAQSMERFVPVEMANLFVDSEDFIFTVTNGNMQSSERSEGKLQRLNALGTNVLRYNEQDVIASGGAMYEKDIYGDVEYAYVREKMADSILVDVHVDEDGFFSALDRERGRVFQYDPESNLLFIFGGIGKQRGTFDIPSAIEKFGEYYVVLDESKNNLTVFEPTEYARNVLAASKLYSEGLYAQAEPLWRKVLEVNANHTLAYRSIGKHYLELKDYEQALNYLKLGQDREAYSLAYAQWRKVWLQENILWLLPVVAAAVLLLRMVLHRVLKMLGFEHKKTRIVFH